MNTSTKTAITKTTYGGQNPAMCQLWLSAMDDASEADRAVSQHGFSYLAAMEQKHLENMLNDSQKQVKRQEKEKRSMTQKAGKLARKVLGLPSVNSTNSKLQPQARALAA